jgi:hypothetical protein
MIITAKISGKGNTPVLSVGFYGIRQFEEVKGDTVPAGKTFNCNGSAVWRAVRCYSGS